MRALRYHREDGNLRVEDVPRPPQPEGNDVLIQVKATAITNGELEWPETRERAFPIPGHDVAGIIAVHLPSIKTLDSKTATTNPRPRPSAHKSQALPPATRSSP